MLDLSGRQQDALVSSETEPKPRPARGQRLWAVLLVLDSFFVIIFGGAMAAKIYQHWQAPALPPVARRRPSPPAENPKPPSPAPPAQSPAPAPATPPAAAKPAEPPAKTAYKARPPKPGEIRPPKPSLLHEAPRHQAASPQGASEQPASAPAAVSQAAAAPSKPGKALPVDFQYKGEGRRVELVGAFIVHGGRKPMVQHDGVWSLTVYLTPNKYRYWFAVDGKKRLDPDNSSVERGASVVIVAPR